MSTKTFSIVVPVFNVRAYLRECIDSLLEQSYADFELIAVDDCSPDGSGEILDSYAARDSRVRVLHLEQNVGLGRARDAGIEVATGEYLLFLDSDDTVEPGSLKAIADRIGQAGRPDILIFDYARTYWDGSRKRNKSYEVLAEPGDAVFTIDQHPELLSLLMIVWNKAYRRDFVAEHGFRFPKGYYEDTPWTYPTLFAAKSIAVLDRVCVLYRQRRHGNILRSTSRKHFDVFDQYQLVFAFLDRHPELGHWRSFVFGRMVTHCLHILRTPHRLPESDRAEFLTKTTEQYKAYLPADYQRPAGPRGVEVHAVATGHYGLYRAIRSLLRTASWGLRRRRKAGRQLTKMKRAARNRAMKRYYRFQLRRPMDEHLAVYGAYWFRGYACNPAAIYEKAKELAPDVHGVWVAQPQNGEPVPMPAGVDVVVPGTRRYYQVLARAKFAVNNVNFPDHMVKRPGSVHLQTQHGVPLKKMGVALVDHPVGSANMRFPALLRRCDRWDYLLSSNRFSTEVWERSYPSDYETLETGYPRNDRLVAADEEEVAKVRATMGIDPARKVILYAPTFRDWRREGFDPQFDLARFCAAVGDQYLLLVRAHYFTHAEGDTITELREKDLVRDVSDYPCVEDLLLASDVLLTDYSSVMFDYAALDRPIVVYADDWETYVRCRGVNFDLPSAPPGVVAFDEAELAGAFTSGRAWGDEATRARQEFRKRFCEFDDGGASERVVRRVFLSEALGGRELRATSVSQDMPHMAVQVTGTVTDTDADTDTDTDSDDVDEQQVPDALADRDQQ